MRNLMFVLSLLHSLTVSSQDPITFSTGQLEEDFKIFRGSLEDFHPGLYWYRDQEEMNRIFEKARARLNRPMTERECYQILSSVVSKVGCGHTYVSLSEKTFEKELVAYLPMQLHFYDAKAYYIKTYAEEQIVIRPGNQITSINGVSMDSIYMACMDMLSGDGFSETGKINMLNAHFWYTYAELFGAPEHYRIHFLNANNEEQILEIPAMPKEEIYESYFADEASEDAKRNIVLKLHHPAATLKIKAFFGWNEAGKRIKVESKLQEVFTILEGQGITQLIIDLRDNGGGRVPWVMHSYFVDEPFLYARNADFIFAKSSPYYAHQKLHPNMKWIKAKWLNTWLPGSNKMSKSNGNRYELTGLFMTKYYAPTSPKFKGEVYILTNGGTFSAASDVAAMLKSTGVATVIGEESGGGYFGNTSMEKSYVTLPNSKLRLEIPLVRHQLNVDADKNAFGRGVIPYHEIVPTVEDVINGVDIQMKWTLDFIQNRSN